MPAPAPGERWRFTTPWGDAEGEDAEALARAVLKLAIAEAVHEAGAYVYSDGANCNAILGKVPAGRLGSAEEVAAAVVFLASTESGYITGHTLNVNGGMVML